MTEEQQGFLLEPAGGRPVADATARELLRKLRDLNLVGSPVELAGGDRVSIAGCLSLDRPVEDELHYLLRSPDGDERILAIAWRDRRLELEVSAGSGPEPRRTRCALLDDEHGRATAPELKARIDPGSANPREVEHFLRRLVRGALAA
jgi:hypothetical protein